MLILIDEEDWADEPVPATLVVVVVVVVLLLLLVLLEAVDTAEDEEPVEE